MISSCRLAATATSRNKITLAVSTTYELWIGNETQDDMEITGDIMGFHKGDWEERVLTGHHISLVGSLIMS